MDGGEELKHSLPIDRVKVRYNNNNDACVHKLNLIVLFSSECINLNAFDKKTTPLMLSLLRVPFRGYPDGGLSRLSIFDKEYRLFGGQGKLSESPQMLNIYNLALTN